MTKERAQNWDYEYMLTKLNEEIIAVYEAKIERYKEMGIDFYEVEKMVFLKQVDNKWIDHIDAMDQLKKGISLRSYGGGNVDPVVEYKREGLEMFEDMTMSIQDDTVHLLLKAELQKIPALKKEEKRDLITNENGAQIPKKAAKTVGRNDLCPCGSGKKYKNCCGA